MQARLKVYRLDPQKGAEPYYQEYTAEVPSEATVLDALLKIREEQDGSLSFRCSCRSAICGSCAMEINHHAQLACKTRLAVVAPKGEQVLVEPMANMTPLKDLVIDQDLFWSKVHAIRPWLEPVQPVPEREYSVPNEKMLELTKTMSCIFCGCCVADCTVMTVDPTWLAPAALAKAYRFTGDPRDAAARERLQLYTQPGGIWDCVHCFECVQQCPKNVAPMDWIMVQRRMAVEAGLTDSNGARHAEAFVDSIKHAGWLNEVTLPIKSSGFSIPELLRLAPVGLRMVLKRKMPSPIHRPIPNVEEVRRLFNRLERKP